MQAGDGVDGQDPARLDCGCHLLLDSGRQGQAARMLVFLQGSYCRYPKGVLPHALIALQNALCPCRTNTR